jgi:hypothetical protein
MLNTNLPLVNLPMKYLKLLNYDQPSYWRINVFLDLMHENNRRLAQEVLKRVLTTRVLLAAIKY